jgi:hypothetical protein
MNVDLAQELLNELQEPRQPLGGCQRCAGRGRPLVGGGIIERGVGIPAYESTSGNQNVARSKQRQRAVDIRLVESRLPDRRGPSTVKSENRPVSGSNRTLKARCNPLQASSSKWRLMGPFALSFGEYRPASLECYRRLLPHHGQ